MKYRVILFILSFVILSASAQAQLQVIKTVAGTGGTGFDGDGGSGEAALLSGPLGVATDQTGNVYIQDFYNNRVRKVNLAGVITTVAGNGNFGYKGDGSIGSNAEIIASGIAVDKTGNIYISDHSHSVIRKVNIYGIITTYAGNGVSGHTGDGGPATTAKIGSPYGLAVDTAGNLYFVDSRFHAVRKVSKKGIISTIAGSGDTSGYAGDGGFATEAALDSPYGVAVDRVGNVFISDFRNNVIRKVDTDQLITTYAGMQWTYNYSGDGGPATDATLNMPRGLAVDTTGNLYIADGENNVIRKVDVNGMISTVVGNGTLGFGGDGGFSLGANLHNPYGVTVDRFGSIYVADANNQKIRVSYNAKLGVSKVGTVSAIELFPNPCSTTFMMGGLSKSDKVCVYDLAGRAVSEVWNIQHDGSQSFDIHSMAPGMYMLQVADADGNRKAVVKLVKN